MHKLEPEPLLVFALVAQTGSLTTAAERLGKTQPAVSAQLKRLQESVGESLYVRHRYGITLTPTGSQLLAHALQVKRSLESAKLFVQELKQGQRGSLHIAASMTVAVYLLPKVLSSFQQQNPHIQVQLLTRNTEEAKGLLEAGEADIAFIEGPLDTKDFIRRMICTDEIVFVTPSKHPLSSRQYIEGKDLQGIHLVRRELGSGTRTVVDRALEAMGVSVKTRLIATGVDTVKEAILHGLGAGFLSQLAVEREAKAGLLHTIPIRAQGFTRTFSMLHPELELCSQLSRSFIDFIGTYPFTKPSNPL